MASNIPSQLSLLPLPPDTVVFPGLTLSLSVTSKHGIQVIRDIVKDASTTPSSDSGTAAQKQVALGCVPLKAQRTVTNALAVAVNRKEGGDGAKGHVGDEPDSGNGNRQESLEVIKTQGAGSRATDASRQPGPEELFQYGTAARLVRLERLSSGSGRGFLVVLEGLARFSFDPTSLDPAAEHHLAEVTVRDPRTDVLPPSHTPFLTFLRQTAIDLLSILSSSSILPFPFVRRLRVLLAALSLSSAASFVDALIGTIPLSQSSTGITYADKLLVLSLLDPVDRVKKGIELFTRETEALKLTKRIEDRVDKDTQRRQREYVLMQQLLAIRQELDELATTKKPSPVITGSGSPLKPSTGRSRSSRSQSAPLGGDEEAEEEDEMRELEEKIEVKAFSEEAKKVAVRELKRLKKSPPQGAEHGVIRNYIETLLAIPWTAADSTQLPKDKDFIAKARKKLDEDHYGLDKIKKRLLEWLAVLRLQSEQADVLLSSSLAAATASATEAALAPSTETAVVLRDPSTSLVPSLPLEPSAPAPSPHPAPILLLHGPPGVGKTSIARSLAEAMGRKFVRISLGGVRDEAEIRGHRRTYVGAMPGKIVSALIKAGTQNPIILLDEIDKIGHDTLRGSPDAALLEVLDPSQNWSFSDHYLGIPIDLSQVLFIATANQLDTISEPLYDRMEAVELSGYVHEEKLRIARQSLLPKQLAAHVLTPSLFTLSDSTLLFLITHFTREAGVRSLERQLAAVCRAKAVEYAEAREQTSPLRANGSMPKGYIPKVGEEDVERILGNSRWDPEEAEKEGNRVGVATGLAYQGSGNGGILHIEAASFPGTGKLHTTGQLGEVISESAHVAVAWTKAHAYELGLSASVKEDVFRNLDLHLHLPAGAVKKDGPSAGVAMAVAVVSLMTGIPTVPRVGMTGEITLRGAVTPVGGIKEKVLAAHRAGLRLLILPARNKRDVESDIPASVKAEVEFVYVRRVEEALKTVFAGKVGVRHRDGERGWVESRL